MKNYYIRKIPWTKNEDKISLYEEDAIFVGMVEEEEKDKYYDSYTKRKYFIFLIPEFIPENIVEEVS